MTPKFCAVGLYIEAFVFTYIREEMIEMNVDTDQNEIKKKYVRYAEGAKQYSMCKTTFRRIASDAHAVHKIGGVSLVNLEIFDKYLDNFRV